MRTPRDFLRARVLRCYGFGSIPARIPPSPPRSCGFCRRNARDVQQARRVVPGDVNTNDQEFEFAVLPQLPENGVDAAVEPPQVMGKAADFRLPRGVVDRPDAPIGLVGASRKGREVDGKTMRPRAGLRRKHVVRAQWGPPSRTSPARSPWRTR